MLFFNNLLRNAANDLMLSRFGIGMVKIEEAVQRACAVHQRTANIAAMFNKHRFRAIAGCGEGCCNTSCAAAADQHITVVVDGSRHRFR